MIKEPWEINHKLAIKRVKENIGRLKAEEQTLESIFKIIFIHPDYPFLQIMNNYGSKDYSYGDILKEIKQFSCFFNENLNNSSDYVGLYLKNSKEWISSFFGLLMSGFKPVLLSTANPFIENKNVIEKLHISYIVCDQVMDYQNITFIPIENILNSQSNKTSTKQFANEIVFLTSGSTGLSKIVFYTGKDICEAIYNSEELFSLVPDLGKPYKRHVKHLVILPFYHVFGLFAVLLWFSFFNVEFVLPKDLSPKAIKHAINVTEPTLIFAVPLFWETIVSEIKKNISQRGVNKKFDSFLKLSASLQNHFGKSGNKLIRNVIFKKHLKEILGPSISFCINGGAPLNDHSLFIMNAIGYSLVNGYGSTEIGITSFCSNKTFKSRISNSIGMPFSSVNYKIDKNTLLVKASSASKHFIDGDKDFILDDADYINTNDNVYFDKNYYIQGRNDEIVILANGETISIPKIESNISFPSSKEFAIVYDEKTKSLILVVSYSITINTLKIKGELKTFKDTSYSKIVKEIYFTNQSLPKANSIKIKRKALLEELQNKDLFFLSTKLEDEKTYNQMLENFNNRIVESVLSSFKRIFPDKDISINSDFYTDLGGDSLKYFLLLSEIETKIDIEIDINKVKNAPRTPQEFIKIIGDFYEMECSKS